jgi:hypothetical protein
MLTRASFNFFKSKSELIEIFWLLFPTTWIYYFPIFFTIFLKTEKACGDDNIINEYIKSSAHLLIPIYVRLFNCIFDSGKVPCTWLSLGFELMAIGIKANKFSILYIVNKRHDTTEHTNQQL